MATESQDSKILKFKKKRQLNIGIIIFGIIFIYLIATIVMYILKPNVTIYEVRDGSLVKDHSYTGLAIRDEAVVYSDGSGYVNYFITENNKVKDGSKIYTLSANTIDFGDVTSADAAGLSSEDKYSIVLQIQDFNHDFSESGFSSSYYLKNEIQSKLNQQNSKNRLNQLNEMLSSNLISNVSIGQSKQDGIVAYYVDGMEDITVETATLDDLKKTNYNKVEFSNNRSVNGGDPVYKLIISDNWTLMIEIDEETAVQLSEKSTVTVNFKKDGKSLKANFEIEEKDGTYVAYLNFTNSMIRYIGERYLDVDLVLEDQEGLKIPKSAEVELEFWVIPKSYLTQGGDSNDDGIMKQVIKKNGNISYEFVELTIYYSDDSKVYFSKSDLSEGDVILKTESNETHEIKYTRSLKGVYCINKGYAVFKPINILCESDDYYIIEEGNRYSLSNYDHIALNSANIKENDIVF